MANVNYNVRVDHQHAPARRTIAKENLFPVSKAESLKSVYIFLIPPLCEENSSNSRSQDAPHSFSNAVGGT